MRVHINSFIYKLLLSVVSIFPGSSYGQDSVNVLSLNEFFNIILTNHPVANQADLITQMARQNLVVARGGFDPYFFSNLYQRRYDGQEYLFLNKSGFKVPAWYGVEFSGNYNINRGTLLNPEHSMPAEGRAVLGISSSLGQGLFIDERRSVLKQARIFKESSEYERIGMLNDLLFTATKDYWDWAMHYNKYVLHNSALTTARLRFEGYKNSFEFGEIPAIDTLEAFTQVQNIEFERNNAFLAFRNATLSVSNHLWLENDVPLELNANMVPQQMDTLEPGINLSDESLKYMLNASSQYHPDLKQLEFKLMNLDIDRRLKLEYLKPKINLNYNIMSKEGLAFNTDPANGNLFNTNYKWGFDIAIPLLWQEGRGNYQLAKLKIQDTRYHLSLKNLEIKNKIEAYFNELTILRDQVKLYEQATNNYSVLLNAEITKFEAGESSLFMINSRQLKLLEFQSKLVEVKTKYYKAMAGLAWSRGTLYNYGE